MITFVIAPFLRSAPGLPPRRFPGLPGRLKWGQEKQARTQGRVEGRVGAALPFLSTEDMGAPHSASPSPDPGSPFLDALLIGDGTSPLHRRMEETRARGSCSERINRGCKSQNESTARSSQDPPLPAWLSDS